MAYAEIMSLETGGGREAATPEGFRHAMRELAAAVCLITTGRGAERAGCAASSVTSLSLDPPTLLVCLSREAATLRALRENGVFAVNILGAKHEPLARRFASAQIHGAERFELGDWSKLRTGAPVLADALAVVDCKVERIVEHATHAIVIGAAVGLLKPSEGAALLHWRSRFETLE